MNFDSHCILQGIRKDQDVVAVNLNSQKVKYFRIDAAQFLDTLAFQQASLDSLCKKLMKQLKTTGGEVTLLRQSELFWDGEHFNSELFELSSGKGIFCYDFVTSLEQMMNYKGLPPIEKFFNSLTMTSVTPEQYEVALKVFDKAGCDTLGSYCIYYGRLDVLWLAEYFLNFFDTCLAGFHVSPCYYVSAPQYALSCCLKKTSTPIQTITSMEQHDFLQQAKRGGFTVALQRLATTPIARHILNSE